MFRVAVGILALLVSVASASDNVLAGEYTIEGTFDGCDYDKLYPLVGGGVLEYQQYRYFYAYRPVVVTDGRRVVTIGDNDVQAMLHNGSVYETMVSGEFNGCDYDKIYKFDNGLIFQCAGYSYSYAYHPEVRIFVVEGREPDVQIKGKTYPGKVFRSQ